MKPGVYPNMPMEQYHAIDAASNSRLTRLRQSPAHLRSYLDEPKKDTKALVIGRAAHTTILEPDMFDSTFRVAQQCMSQTAKLERCSKMGTQYYGDLLGWRCSTEAHSRGLPTPDTELLALPEADFIACQGMRRAVMGRATARGLLTGAEDVEVSLVWVDAETGVLCKARPDVLNRRLNTIADLKSTRDASEREFARSIFTYGYHRQGAFYLDGATTLGIEVEHFAILPVEKVPPFASATYRLTEGAIDAGRDQLRTLLARYAECLATNTWPAYPDEVRDVSLPDYAWRQIEEEVAA